MQTVEIIERNGEMTHTQKEKKIFSILSVFMMLGNVYIFPLISVLGWGEVIFLVFMPYFVIRLRLRRNMSISRTEFGFVIFMIYGFVITLLTGTIFQTSITVIAARFARDFFYYFIIIFLGTKLLDKEIFFKWINYFCICLSVFVMLQSIVYILTGYFIPGFPLNVLINDGRHMGSQIYSNYIAYAKIAGYLRPNGFLCEPAHCAQCFFVDLIILLFDDSEINNTKFICAGIVSIGSLLTMSTSAVVYVAVAWLMWLIVEGKHNIIKTIAIIGIVGVIFFFAYNRGNLDNMISVINRLTNVFTEDDITNSTSLRIQKGLTIYGYLPLAFKIFGIGFGTYSSALSSSVITTSVAMAKNEYMNSFSYILVSSGIVGGFIMLVSFIGLYRHSLRIGRAMIIALLIMSLGASIYSSSICVWIMLVILNSTFSRIERMT